MSEILDRIPRLSRRVPTVTSGATVTGSEVIDCRVVVGAVSSSREFPLVELTAEGIWEVGVPEAPVPLTDFLDLADEPRLADDGWRRAGIALVDRLTSLVEHHPVRAKRHRVQVALPVGTTKRNIRNFVQGLVSVGRPLIVSRREAPPVVRDIHLDLTYVEESVAAACEREIRLGTVLGEATALARDLDSLPEGIATADWWRNEAKGIMGNLPGTRVRIRGVGWLERKGFGGLLAMSENPAKNAALVKVVWDPAAAEGELTDAPPDAVIVGGAHVLAIVRALAQARSPQRVVGLIPVTGPMRTLHSSAPGQPDDIVEHAGGLTTVLNSGDGESQQLAARVVSADCLAYASQRFRPSQIISMGPTTTATKVALGARTAGVFAEDAARAKRLTLRGARVGERWWPMPMPSALDARLAAQSADLKGDPDGPEAVMAALYLRRFTAGVPYIHLDTAGPAWGISQPGDTAPGATGFGTRTLVEWLRK